MNPQYADPRYSHLNHSNSNRNSNNNNDNNNNNNNNNNRGHNNNNSNNNGINNNSRSNNNDGNRNINNNSRANNTPNNINNNANTSNTTSNNSSNNNNNNPGNKRNNDFRNSNNSDNNRNNNNFNSNASNKNDYRNSNTNDHHDNHHFDHGRHHGQHYGNHDNHGNESSKPVMYHGIPMYEDKKKIANETLSIIQAGSYTLNGSTINIKQQIDQCVNSTKVYQTQEDINIQNIPSNSSLCKFDITVESTLESANRILGMGIDNVAVLNFASATKPGGGWINGRDAQEESITRQSALYLSINSKEPNKYFYQIHEKLLKSDDPEKNLYTNAIIYSPKVPVIRDSQKEDLLPKPFYVSFITSPATNLKLLIEDFQKNEKGSKLPNIYKDDSKKPKFDHPQQFNQRSGYGKKGSFNQPRNSYNKIPSQPLANYSQSQVPNAMQPAYNNFQKGGYGQPQPPSHPQYKPSLPSIKNDNSNPRKNYNNKDPRYQNFQDKIANEPNNALIQSQSSNLPKANTRPPGQQNQPTDYQKSGKSNKPDDINSLKEKNRQVMYTRCEKIIKVCIANKNKAIVLGAFGCGIFGNDPTEVADIFYEVLVTKKLGNYLDYVVFALKGAKTNGYTFTSFKNKFL